jgi:hypothetical protein
MDAIINKIDNDVGNLDANANVLQDAHLALLPEFHNLQHFTVTGRKGYFNNARYREMFSRAYGEERGKWNIPLLTTMTVREKGFPLYGPDSCVAIERESGVVFFLADGNEPMDAFQIAQISQLLGTIHFPSTLQYPESANYPVSDEFPITAQFPGSIPYVGYAQFAHRLRSDQRIPFGLWAQITRAAPVPPNFQSALCPPFPWSTQYPHYHGYVIENYHDIESTLYLESAYQLLRSAQYVGVTPYHQYLGDGPRFLERAQIISRDAAADINSDSASPFIAANINDVLNDGEAEPEDFENFSNPSLRD